MNLVAAKAAIEAALSAVEGVSMLPKPPNPPKAGAGFLLPSRVVPSQDSFTQCAATFEGSVFLGTDLAASVAKYGSMSVAVVNALTTSDLGVYGVASEFEVNADGAFYLAITVTLEVD